MTYKPNYFKYKMSKTLAKELLKDYKGDPQPYLCKVVNEQFNLKGICTEVIYF